MVYQVLMDKATNKARGVTYVDRITRETREIRAKTVVLCAQALESTRILLNSAKDGLGNSSGVLGEYLMDHMWVAGGAAGEFPDMPGKPSLNTAHRPGGPYVIRFRNTAKGERHKDFVRGYGFQGGSQLAFTMGAPGFGQAYKDAVKNGQWTMDLVRLRRVPAVQAQSHHVEQERHRRLRHPRAAHRRRLGREREEDDPRHGGERRRDARGVRREERAAPSRMRIASRATASTRWARRAMGSDPKQSVLNQFQQSHDVKNLFVMDAAGFPSGACQNPTLTIMAMAVRSTDYLMEQFKKRNL